MSNTVTKILDTAQELAQRRGFNAFSYADISSEVGIKKASIHYHFPTKTDLGIELIERYRKNFNGMLEVIYKEKTNAFEKIKEYISLYKNTLLDNRMCLCGMLASDFSTLPKEMQDFVENFFTDNENWLKKVLEEGKSEKSLKYLGGSNEQAQFLLSSIQGALLVSRAGSNVKKFNRITNELLNTLRG